MHKDCRVLVVEDRERDRERARVTIEALGHAVDVAKDGSEALGHLEREVPHVVLLDVMMPGMDGASFMEALRERGLREKVRVVLHTAVTSPLVRKLLGADACVYKPATTLELVRAIRDACTCGPANGPPATA